MYKTKMAEGQNLQLDARFITNEDDLEPGDHIAIDCTAKGLQIQHHGIVVKGKHTLKVISFSSNEKKGGEGHEGFKKESVSEFSGHEHISKTMKIIYGSGQVLDALEVVRRAESYLSDPWKFKEYHYLENNCEHFATYCKADLKYSAQTRLGNIILILIKSYIAPVASKLGQKWKS